MEGGAALCSVRKDGGDDIDATHGLLITARVEKRSEPGVSIEGGEGVGWVTKPGLDQSVGAAAINRVPRRMIEEEVLSVGDALGYEGGFRVTVSVPGGEEAAKKTFNPQLRIEGGISILGTSGIVEPMSTQALVDTIALEIRQKAAQGHRNIILTPGNYGTDFLRTQGMDRWGHPIVKCSNFIGDALDACGAEHMQGVLLVGHLGKLVKLAGGIMNTHSRTADCRTELFCTYAALRGAGPELCRALMDCAASDACVAVGAGPGAPDLITLRGAELLRQAEVVIYAGSLVNPALLELCPLDCAVHNSAAMTLEQVLTVMEQAEQAGKTTVRLHTGDPCLYGAIQEQMDALDRLGIPYDITPGVSSFCGAAAALGVELTLPGVSQSVILTRMAGRIPVPERESISALAAHGASMVIFLSARYERSRLYDPTFTTGYREGQP